MTPARSRLLAYSALTMLLLVVAAIPWVWDVLKVPPFPPTRQPDAMERYFATLVARNCGRVPIGGNASAASDCVVQAIRSGQPFVVRYDIPGFDSQLAAGLVGSGDGRILEMTYDSIGDTLRTRNCSMPLNLTRTSLNRLTCFPEDLKGR